MGNKNILILLALGCLAFFVASCDDGDSRAILDSVQEVEESLQSAPSISDEDEVDAVATAPEDAADDTPEEPVDAEGALAEAEGDAGQADEEADAMDFAMADLSDILYEAIVYTTNVQGDPYTSGSLFSVDLAVASPYEDPPMSYAVRIFYHGDYVEIERMEGTEPGLPRPMAGPVQGAGANTYRLIMSPGDMNNTLKNMTMCRLYFRVIATPEEPYSIRAAEDPYNVSLPSITLDPLLHEYSNVATDPLPRPGEDGGE